MKLAAPKPKYIEHLLMATQVTNLHSWDGQLTANFRSEQSTKFSDL